MQITLNDTTPIDQYPYLEVGGGQLDSNGNAAVHHKILPIYLGELEAKKTGIDYLIICSDLQGIAEEMVERKLLGEALPEYLKLLLEVELNIQETSKVGVLLAGDFYTSLEKRGASGDVRKVWIAFKEQFDWVMGVAGNHDRFGDNKEQEIFEEQEGIYLLHQEIKSIDGLKIGGIGGIIGRSDKTNRVDEKEYLATLKKLLNQDLDFILLHETPDYPPLNFIGNSAIRTTIENNASSTIICGHCFWEKTKVVLDNETQIINVDSKVIILKVVK